MKFKSRTDWFRVHSVRKIEDPSEQIDRRELVVSLDQFPIDIGLGPNPRRPDPKSRVAQDIAETLRDNGSNFHLLNRGITILARDLDYDNKTERARLHLDESEAEAAHYGILDGGNTYAQVNAYRQSVSENEDGEDKLGRIFVNVQVLVPRGHDVEAVEALLNDIKEARNNSVQVKQKSLADARHHYDLLKEVLKDEPYYAEISWREGDKGQIDVLTILTVLMLYFPPFSEDAPDKQPNGAYGRKEKCLDAFLAYSDKPEQAALLERYIPHVPQMLRLFDEIQETFPGHVGGRFGGITEVKIFDEKKYERGSKKYRKTPVRTTFLGRDMKYDYPNGWLYPLLAAFRYLLEPSTTSPGVAWKRDPVAFWSQHGSEICERYEPFFRSVGYDTKKIATSATTYSAMRDVIKDLHQRELLKKAGIVA